jgi:hypothetical protein
MKTITELKAAIATLVDYNRDEERDWEQSVYMQNGTDFELSGYDPTLCPGHIYHSIRKLRQFISGHGE